MTDRILIIDDNRVIREILRRRLEMEGYELILASGGKAGLNICLNTPPDLVILDVSMPSFNGYDVCRALQNSSATKDIPVIFLSGKSGDTDKIKGLELGAVDYITKPFSCGEVLARVKSHLKIRHLTRSLIDANRRLSEKQRHIDRDLRAAAHLQKNLIPKRAPSVPDFRFAWQFIPCEQVGGDIFDIEFLDENHLMIYAIDVSGHGVPAAMLTVAVYQNLLPKTGSLSKMMISEPPYYRIVPPAQVLTGLDKAYPFERFEKYFTIAYAILNFKTGSVSYSSAGHPPPVLVTSEKKIRLLKKGGAIIGLGDMVPFESGKIQMHPGDRLYLYTDGVIDNKHRRGQAYARQKFYSKLAEYHGTPLDVTCKIIVGSLTRQDGEFNPEDDVTLVGIEYKRT